MLITLGPVFKFVCTEGFSTRKLVFYRGFRLESLDIGCGRGRKDGSCDPL